VDKKRGEKTRAPVSFPPAVAPFFPDLVFAFEQIFIHSQKTGTQRSCGWNVFGSSLGHGLLPGNTKGRLICLPPVQVDSGVPLLLAAIGSLL